MTYFPLVVCVWLPFQMAVFPLGYDWVLASSHGHLLIEVCVSASMNDPTI